MSDLQRRLFRKAVWLLACAERVNADKPIEPNRERDSPLLQQVRTELLDKPYHKVKDQMLLAKESFLQDTREFSVAKRAINENLRGKNIALRMNKVSFGSYTYRPVMYAANSSRPLEIANSVIQGSIYGLTPFMPHLAMYPWERSIAASQVEEIATYPTLMVRPPQRTWSRHIDEIHITTPKLTEDPYFQILPTPNKPAGYFNRWARTDVLSREDDNHVFRKPSTLILAARALRGGDSLLYTVFGK